MEAELATGRVRVAAATGPEGRLTKQRAVSSKLPSSSFPLPIAQTIAILHKWGIHTLGQLAALDKEELAATATRFRKCVNATRRLTRGVRI